MDRRTSFISIYVLRARAMTNTSQTAMTDHQILYLRGKVSKIFRESDAPGGKVIVWGADTLSDRTVEIAADLVVLATPMIPATGSVELGQLLHISTDSYGFFNEAVLVVGAGIGGMQASLDLAEAGLKVYLLESSRHRRHDGPARQDLPHQRLRHVHHVAQAGGGGPAPEHRHPPPPTCRRSAASRATSRPKIRQHPRYVNIEPAPAAATAPRPARSRLDLFNGGLSTAQSHLQALSAGHPQRLCHRKAGRGPLPGRLPDQPARPGLCGPDPREGRFADAYRTIKEDNPFPSVCGRVCNHRCEEACSRARATSRSTSWPSSASWPIGRAPTEEAPQFDSPRPARAQRQKSGRGRLRAGWDDLRPRPGAQGPRRDRLRSAAGPRRHDAGGRAGIPPALRPGAGRDRRDPGRRRGAGAQPPVEDAPALLEQGFDAVFVAVGRPRRHQAAHPGRRPAPGVMATDFLRKVSLQQATGSENLPELAGKRVLVLGGGNVAIDAAMSAVRLGAGWVGMSCLESRETMPAHDWEVRDAEEEGIEVFPSRTFKESHRKMAAVTGVRCVQVNFRGFIEGRPDFDELPGTEEIIPADVVIFAIGQRPEIELPGRQGRDRPRPLPQGRPGNPGDQPARIFRRRRCHHRHLFIVDAIAAGHKAARSIDRYLKGQAPAEAGENRPPAVNLDPDEIQLRRR
jgi:thioredoxin reductase